MPFMKIKEKLPTKPFDFVIISLAFLLTGFSAYSVYIVPRDTTQVLIQGAKHNWVFPLDAEETIPVSGPLGNTIVRIHDNQTWVESSPCDNQVCVAAGRLTRTWHFAACLPNNVLLMIEGTSSDGLDSRIW